MLTSAGRADGGQTAPPVADANGTYRLWGASRRDDHNREEQTLLWSTRRREPTAAGSHPSSIDPITGLGSRRGMVRALEEALRARRPSSLVLLDVDGFRAFRARKGEDAADALLLRVADRLRAADGGPGFRVTEGQFVVLLPGVTDARSFGEQLVEDVVRTCAGLRLSVGTVRTTPAMNLADLLAAGEVAVATARRRGDGTVIDHARCAEQGIASVSVEKLDAMTQLLREQDLRVHYQPIVDLDTLEPVAYEALVRPQANYAFDGPVDAFRVAAELDLVSELDAVCRRSILADGPGFDLPPGCRLHINVSPLSLGHHSLGGVALRRQLAAAGLQPRQVVLEFTEQYAAEPPVVDRELDRLRGLGLRLVLDDVGLGGTAIRRMLSGRFDGLKIAGDVLRATRSSRHAEGLLRGLCTYAEHTGAELIAAGIEDEGMLATVRRFRTNGPHENRIAEAQGYLLGRPQPRARPSNALPPTGSEPVMLLPGEDGSTSG